MKKISIILISCLLALASGCNAGERRVVTAAHEENSLNIERLRDTLSSIIGEYHGEIGVALIYENSDTISVGNEVKYPMMSVFKLHQSLAVCDYLIRNDLGMDSLVSIPRSELNRSTWSPMLKDYGEDTIRISLRELIRYALEQSDNNASNYLFDHLVSPAETDEYVATLIPRESFKIVHSEAQMLNDHTLAYRNVTSPVGAAALINILFTDPMLLGSGYGSLIRESLERCQTGRDRIVAPLQEIEGIRIGHKTGSGFRDNGILAAHNDLAYIELPDGRHYSLAIFVKDFHGSEQLASEAISRLSAAVQMFLKNGL